MPGISVRSWQAAGLQYCTYGNYGHNLWSIPHWFPIVGKPKVKQLDELIYDAFWALAPHLGLHLYSTLVYFTLSKSKLWKPNNVPPGIPTLALAL